MISSLGQQHVSPAIAKRFAWLVISMFFAGGVISYIDRAALGIVMPQIRKDLSLTNTDYAIVVNCFLVSYGAFYILGGWLADRLGLRRAYPTLVICWSVANMLHAFAGSLFGLCLCRALLGMAEGGFFPAAIRGATEWFPSATRAKAIALYFCGSSLGSLLTPPLVAWTALRFGWRGAFITTGGLGLLVVPLWYLLHNKIYHTYGRWDPAPVFSSEEEAKFSAALDVPLRAVLRRSKYWLLLISRALCDSVWFFYIFWMPGYFQEARAFSLHLVGVLLWIPYLTADAGALLGAWISSALVKRGHSISYSLRVVLIGSGFFCMIGSITDFIPNSFAALGFVSLALFGALSYGSSINTAITEVIPRKHVAVLYGVTGAAGTALAAISQPVVGHLVDSIGYKIAFVGSGLAFALALTLLLCAGTIEPIRGG